VNSKISVALCTYNGAEFVAEFLYSIATQTMLPNELVVCDDRSTDATVDIVEDFARYSPFPIAIMRNQSKLGVTKNFEQAVKSCSGEIIALADQDDLWMPCKLSRISQALEVSDRAAVFSDAVVVTEDLAPLGYTMWERVCFDMHEQKRMLNGEAFPVLLKHRIVTGATLAFRSSLRKAVLPIPAEWSHDEWIALIASATDGILPIDKSLISYRQHRGNVIGGRKKSLWDEIKAARRLNRHAWYNKEINKLLILNERLDVLGVVVPIREKLRDKIAHLNARLAMPETRLQRLPVVAREVRSGRYTAYARNWGSVAIDLLIR